MKPSLPLLYPKDLLTEGKDVFFAPLNIPFERRLQTLVIVLWLLALPISMVISILIAAALGAAWFYGSSNLASLGAGIVVAYVATYLFYRPYQRKGAKIRRFLNSRFFQTLSNLFCQFFPSRVLFDGLSLEESENADLVEAQFFRKGERYLCCCHPHGLFGLSVWGAFVANPTNIHGGHVALHKLIHGAKRSLRSTVHTMTVNFRIPAWREWLLVLGFCDVERKTLIRCMREDPDTTLGHISVLVPGGAAESVYCTEATLTLKHRKGFVKIAVETGCHLVPVYTFGETKLYKPWTRNRRVLSILQRLQKALGIGTPLVCGRGVFNYGFGMLPHREMLTTVVGKPIPVARCVDPETGKAPADVVDRVHQQYVDALTDLYQRYQPLFDKKGPSSLVLQ